MLQLPPCDDQFLSSPESRIDKPKVTFQHGSRLLANGKYVGTVDFVQADGTIVIRPINYPEQFDTGEEAAAHAYREAVRGRAFPF